MTIRVDTYRCDICAGNRLRDGSAWRHQVSTIVPQTLAERVPIETLRDFDVCTRANAVQIGSLDGESCRFAALHILDRIIGSGID